MAELPLLTSVDGLITPASEALLPLPDDGFFRGDGVFEVMRCYRGRPFALGEHLDRMERSAATIDMAIDRAAVESDISELLGRVSGEDCLLRIVVTRTGRRVLSIEALPVHPPSVSLATVTYSPTVILNGVKSLSYAANMQATRIAKKAGADEALLVTGEDLVLEPPTSTLFWVSSGGRLRTTDTGAGVLDSITRRRVIAGCDVEIGSYDLSDVLAASEAFLASTTREIQAVRSIDGQTIPTEPSPRTREAAEVFVMAVAADGAQS
jgi:branched-chain amino acid aminotransferase